MISLQLVLSACPCLCELTVSHSVQCAVCSVQLMHWCELSKITESALLCANVHRSSIEPHKEKCTAGPSCSCSLHCCVFCFDVAVAGIAKICVKSKAPQVVRSKQCQRQTENAAAFITVDHCLQLPCKMYLWSSL